MLGVATVYGWARGAKPSDAPDVYDDDDGDGLLAWAARSTVIAVRIDPRGDVMLRVDSDMLDALARGGRDG